MTDFDLIQISEESAKRVLLIEDNDTHRCLMQNELKHQNYALEITQDSETALSFLNQDLTFDLIIMDFRLPARKGETANTREGLKVLECMQTKLKGIPADGAIILVVSAYLDELEKHSIKRIINKTFPKPFSLQQFREYVDALWR